MLLIASLYHRFDLMFIVISISYGFWMFLICSNVILIIKLWILCHSYISNLAWLFLPCFNWLELKHANLLMKMEVFKGVLDFLKFFIFIFFPLNICSSMYIQNIYITYQFFFCGVGGKEKIGYIFFIFILLSFKNYFITFLICCRGIHVMENVTSFSIYGFF